MTPAQARAQHAAWRGGNADAHTFAQPGAGARRRTDLDARTRAWLTGIWTDATAGLASGTGLALAAVGSVGRGEAGPLSDVDLVLLHSGRALSDREVTALADRLWYPVWDAGVRLDHSVRTVAQCRSVAQSDLAAAVGLLDLSWVAGDADVVTQARTAVAQDWRGAARRRLPEVVTSLAARHTRQGDLAQSLEPDLKEAHGGLRDVTVLAALVQSWLVDRPHGPVEEAAARLLDVRDAIHVVTGRGRDRLLRDDHDAVASLLGYADADDLLTDVSRAGRTIAHALDAAVRRAGQAQRARVLRIGPRRPQMTPLGHGVFASDGEVVLGREPALTDPLLPLRVAVVAASAALPIAARTLANLASVPPLPRPWPAPARELLGDLLAAGPGLLPTWEDLDLAGIVESWLPEWAGVRSRPQRSPVHRHTVDRHLLETVTYAAGLVRRVARPDLLLVAALLHDIGKVRGARDHSVSGAQLAAGVVARMGFDAADAETIVMLVREHLTLIELATRRDHADPGTVAAVVSAVGADADRFEMLRALTEADAVAAGPAAWTDWRARLVAQLSGRVTERLSGADVGESAASEGAEVDHGAASLRNLDPADLAAVRSGRFVVHGIPLGSGWRLDVLAADRLGLFADTAGVLAAAGLIVRTAIVRTLDGVAVNEWHVDAPGGGAPVIVDLVRSLERVSAGDATPLGLLARGSGGVALPSGSTPTSAPGQARAMIVPGASPEATVLEVRAGDRPGLLYDLGRAFAGAGISVRSAHVATYAGQTLDTFYLTDPGGGPLAPSVVAQVVGLVIDVCES